MGSSSSTSKHPIILEPEPIKLKGLGGCCSADGSNPNVPKCVSCSDPNGSAFDFDKVSQALLCIIYNIDGLRTDAPAKFTTVPFYFNASMTFNIVSPYLALAQSSGRGICGSAPLCYSSAQTGAQGPALTEYYMDDGSHTDGSKAPYITNAYGSLYSSNTVAPATYNFVKSSTGGILVQVVQPNSMVGYLTFKSIGAGIYGPNVVPTQREAEVIGAKFGVVGTTDINSRTSILLLYWDNTITDGKARMMVSIGSNGDSTILTPDQLAPSLTDTPTMSVRMLYHGLYVTPPPVYDASQYIYCDSLMTLVDLSGNLQYNNPFNMGIWFLVTSLDTSSALAFMQSNCMGLRKGADGNHTYFSGDSANNTTTLLCKQAYNVDTISGDGVYRLLCGIDPVTQSPIYEGTDPNANPRKDALATIDCSCINFEQSTFPQPTLLGKDYVDYVQYLEDNKIRFTPTGSDACWWPSCNLGLGGSVLKTSTQQTDRENCPISFNLCITSIANQDNTGSNVVNNLINICGTTSNGPSSGYPPSVTPAPSKGGITSESWFWPVIIAACVIIVAAIIILLVRKPAPSNKPKIVYVGPKNQPPPVFAPPPPPLPQPPVFAPPPPPPFPYPPPFLPPPPPNMTKP